jgi:predicted RNase H-like nuclease
VSRPFGAARFVGIDLAWHAGNPSGVATLVGRAFPLRLAAPPAILGSHANVLAWLGIEARGEPLVVGIDAPLLGLGGRRRRRPCDDVVARAFGRFHASTHTPPAAPDLDAFVTRLRRRYGVATLALDRGPARGRPAVREVYPNALQVLLFGVDHRPRAAIMPYKRRRFTTKRAWADHGLRPFLEACRGALEGRYVEAEAAAWRALVGRRPRAGMPGRALKAIEDSWDAVLCALAAALDHLAPGVMRAYAPPGRAGWRRGYILGPVLPTAAAGPATPERGTGRPPPGGAGDSR